MNIQVKDDSNVKFHEFIKSLFVSLGVGCTDDFGVDPMQSGFYLIFQVFKVIIFSQEVNQSNFVENLSIGTLDSLETSFFNQRSKFVIA